MSDGEQRIKALEDLRAQIEVAAAKKLAPPPAQPAASRRPWWRRHRRIAMGAGAAVLAAGAAATAAELIGVGEEIPDRADKSARYDPGPRGSRVVATAPDPAGDSVWGVATYRSPDGQPCAIAGQLRGRQLGRIEDDVFRPYAPDVSGICGDLSRFATVLDVLPTESPSRTLVYGRARPGVTAVEARHSGGVERTDVVDDAFLFVFEGRLQPADVAVRPAPR